MRTKISVPLLNSALNCGTLPEYFRLLSELDVARVFIAVDRCAFYSRGEKRLAYLGSLRENICAFRAEGYETGIWLQAYGFGTPLKESEKSVARKYTPLRSAAGREYPDCDMFCPENTAYTADTLAFIQDVLRSSDCKMLLLDDDLCLSVRPGLGCFCEKHISQMQNILGERLKGRDLFALIFSGGRNRYRDAWLKAAGDTNRRFAELVRKAADEIDPDIRIGLCAGFTSWDIEGADALELSKILAGHTRPFLRFTGAPYWAAPATDRFGGQPLGAIIEEVRAQEFYCRRAGADVLFEADTYPRPRYMVPSSFLECFALPLYASGGMGELGYFFSYYSDPGYETGYLRHRLFNKSLYDFIGLHFADKQCRGVHVYHHMHKIADAQIGKNESEESVMESHFNRGAELLAVHGIPTVYDENADCGIAFGEEARHLKKLPEKLIIDARAALILSAAGTDVGYEHIENIPAQQAPRFERTPARKILLPKSESDGYYRTELKKDAAVLSAFDSDGILYPAAYRYKSGGTEFFVLTFDAAKMGHHAAALRSYLRAEQLRSFCEGLPFIRNAPSVYQICKKNSDETALLFANISEDPIIDGEIELDKEYADAELCRACGTLSGKKLLLTEAVAPYGVFAVLLKNKSGTPCR